MTDFPNAPAMAGAAGHASTEAAKKTISELLDVVLGILFPIALFIAGVSLATQIGGFVTVGNFIWNQIGGGAKNLATPLTGPQTGALVGVIFAALWGIPAIAILKMGWSQKNWLGYALRSVGAFLAGLAAFSAYYIVYSLGGGSSSMLGSGGAIDNLMSGVTTATQRATGG